MSKLTDIFRDFKAPTRQMENWKYTSLRKLMECEFTHDLVGASCGSPYKTSIPLSLHPFAHLASMVEIETLSITQSPSSPINLIYSQEKNTAKIIHQKIIVAENIHAEIIFEYISNDDTACFTNQVIEISLEKNAKLSIYKKQTLNKNSFLIDFIQVNQAEESVFNSFTLDKGATLSRTDFVVNLNAPHAEANLQGVYLTKDEQVADHHSVIHHHAPHCQSRQHYRGILQDKSKAIFNGKVVFEKDAQKSVTQQLNKNLLLSNQAEIDTKPELEIYADDVKASHGATVGQLDQQALFYLQARGIHLEEAKGLLMEGFLKEVFLTIENKELQNSFVGATGGRPLQI